MIIYKSDFSLAHNFVFIHENEKSQQKDLKRNISTFQKTKNHQNPLTIQGTTTKLTYQ